MYSPYFFNGSSSYSPFCFNILTKNFLSFSSTSGSCCNDRSGKSSTLPAVLSAISSASRAHTSRATSAPRTSPPAPAFSVLQSLASSTQDHPAVRHVRYEPLLVLRVRPVAPRWVRSLRALSINGTLFTCVHLNLSQRTNYIQHG